MKLDHFLIPNIKISFKWIKDFNVRPEIIKLPKESIGKGLLGIDLASEFYTLSITLKEPAAEVKINKGD